jgi:CRP-like cAMP-binding protein
MVFILFFLSKIQIVGEIHAGDSFGELALIHETHRRASVICKEQSEFLRLDKDDFNQV